jgi:hypothetical protein
VDWVQLGAADFCDREKMSGADAEKIPILGVLLLDRRKKSAYNRAD